MFECECEEACEVLGYAVQPSQASLSTMGVNQLLTDAITRTRTSYIRKLELRNRVLPDEFQTTIEYMWNVISSLDGEYIFFDSKIP